MLPEYSFKLLSSKKESWNQLIIILYFLLWWTCCLHFPFNIDSFVFQTSISSPELKRRCTILPFVNICTNSSGDDWRGCLLLWGWSHEEVWRQFWTLDSDVASNWDTLVEMRDYHSITICKELHAWNIMFLLAIDKIINKGIIKTIRQIKIFKYNIAMSILLTNKKMIIQLKNIRIFLDKL